MAATAGATAAEAEVSPTPDVTAGGGTISGRATVIDSATLSINGQTLHLFGVSGRGGEAAGQLQAFLDSQGGTVTCTAEQHAYRCILPNGVDIARAALYNGAATPAPDATADYAAQSRAAVAAHRGIWRDGAGDGVPVPKPEQPPIPNGTGDSTAAQPAAPAASNDAASAPKPSHHHHASHHHKDAEHAAAPQRAGADHVPESLGGGVHLPGSMAGDAHLPGAHHGGHSRPQPGGTGHYGGSAHGAGTSAPHSATPAAAESHAAAAGLPSPPGAPAPSGQDEAKSVDDAVRRLAQGCVAFNVPDHMRLGRSQAVHANISPDPSCKSAVQSLQGTPNVEAAPLRLSMIMRGTLSGGEAFAISPSEQQSQMISETDITTFAWQVTPKQTGQQVLMLRFDLVLSVGGKEGVRTVTSLERRITVEVGWPKFLSEWAKLARDIGEFVGWIFPAALALLALLGFEWAKRAKRKIDDPAGPEGGPGPAVTPRTANRLSIAADKVHPSGIGLRHPKRPASVKK